ncbi:MAG: DUF4402 domain-containing protein [Flavobacteriaceae bacterium]|nr:DUF4402 domain-containing protein [Flavobacteriaceae bacterium]
MKKTIFTMLAIAMMAGVSNNAMAQNSAMANSEVIATVIAPISINMGATLSFGNIIKGNGTVTVKPIGGKESSYNAFTITQDGADANGTFKVSGEKGYTYSIVLPVNDFVVLRDSDSNSMAVSDFTCISIGSPSENLIGTLSSKGGDTLMVGATITVTDSQAPGSYSAIYMVTVSYN